VGSIGAASFAAAMAVATGSWGAHDGGRKSSVLVIYCYAVHIETFFSNEIKEVAQIMQDLLVQTELRVFGLRVE